MKKEACFIFLALLLALFVELPVLPAIQQTPEKNSGMFLYVGQQMMEGKTLYKEVWDHKPPLVFMLNAFALILGGGGLWGVWVLQLVFTALAVFLLLKVLERVFGLFPAVFAVTGAMLALFLINHGGNYCENYALLFQAAGLWLFLEGSNKPKRWWLFLLAGVAIGLAFMLKQNQIGFGIALGIILVLRALFHPRPENLWAAVAPWLGFAAVVLAFVGFFFVTGNFAAFWDAAFGYNLAYTRLGLLERLKAILDIVEELSSMPAFALALASWLVALAAVFWRVSQGGGVAGALTEKFGGERFRWAMIFIGLAGVAAGLGMVWLKGGSPGFGLLQILSVSLGIFLVSFAWADRRWDLFKRFSGLLRNLRLMLDDDVAPLVEMVALWFPLDIFLVGLSGRTYIYYFITLTPSVACLLAFLTYWMLRTGTGRVNLVKIVIIDFLIVIAAGPLISFFNSLKPADDPQISAAVEVVQSNSKPGDTVLTWGSNPLINFFARRPQPVRYIHSWLYYTEHDALLQRQEELLDSLKTVQPALILDTHDPDAPFPKDMQSCQVENGKSQPGELAKVFDYICKHYTLAGRIGPEAWPLYRLVQ